MCLGGREHISNQSRHPLADENHSPLPHPCGQAYFFFLIRLQRQAYRRASVFEKEAAGHSVSSRMFSWTDKGQLSCLWYALFGHRCVYPRLKGSRLGYKEARWNQRT